MKSNEAIKERLKVNLEKLKMVLTIIILLTGGLLTLLLNGLDSSLKVTIFTSGNVILFFFSIYFFSINNRIDFLLKQIKY